MKSKVLFAVILLLLPAVCSAEESSWSFNWNFSAGGGVWRNETDGHIKYKDNPSLDVDYLAYDSENRGYAWAELQHNFPILPNLRFEYSDVNFSDRSKTGFVWEDVVFTANTFSRTKLQQIDAAAFYNVFKLSWLKLALGLDVKYLDFSFYADGKGTAFSNQPVIQGYYEIEEEDIFVPLLYGNVRIDIFNTGFGIEGEVKFITYKSTDVRDLSIKADWVYDFGLLKAGVEAGYRYENLDLDQDDFSSIDFDADVDIKGPFAGLLVRF